MSQGNSGRRGGGRPSPSMVVALIALFVALSGSAYAAIAKNAVGTRQLKSKAVTTGKIANNAIKTKFRIVTWICENLSCIYRIGSAPYAHPFTRRPTS